MQILIILKFVPYLPFWVIQWLLCNFSDDVRRVSLNYMSCHMDKVVTSRSFATLPQDLMLDIIQETTSKLTIKD